MNNLRPVLTAIVFVAVLVLVLVREADSPNLDGNCVVASDCNWEDQFPDGEVVPGVTVKQFRKDIQDAIDAVTGPVFKIYDAPGGSIGDHWDLYRFYARRNTKFEVLGDCASACALVLGAVDKSNLCVGPKANFAFHQAREKDPPHAISVEATQWIASRYSGLD